MLPCVTAALKNKGVAFFVCVLGGAGFFTALIVQTSPVGSRLEK